MLKLALFFAALGMTPAGFVLPVSPAGADAATAHVVRSIFEYSRWPRPTETVRLCVAGATDHAEALDGITLSDGRGVRRIDVPGGRLPAPGQCDALYLGRQSAAEIAHAVAAVRGQGVVTIAEADPDCASEEMFCLIYSARAIAFRLNVDAISRSGVRIDPRILRLSQGGDR